MRPVYDPKSFEGVDLRKYHIRTIKDAIKFLEFVSSRMEEAQFILKKFNNEHATFKTISRQLQRRVEKQQESYGAAPKVEDNKEKEDEIQKVDDSAEKEKEALLDEMRQAVANEEPTTEKEVEIKEDEVDRKVVQLDKYKAVNGKRGVMFYRKGVMGFKLVSRKDVPVDIRDRLTDALEAE